MGFAHASVGPQSHKLRDGRMTADESAIETTSNRFVYENRWMRVREDTNRRRDGSTGIYGVVEKSDFVVIVPVEDDGQVHLVEQYRCPVKGSYWELPQNP